MGAVSHQRQLIAKAATKRREIEPVHSKTRAKTQRFHKTLTFMM